MSQWKRILVALTPEQHEWLLKKSKEKQRTATDQLRNMIDKWDELVAKTTKKSP